jgi:molybdenum cofactor cytidylyltransferase
VAIVTAAGRGERFGGAKLLADLHGAPLLHHTLCALLDGGADGVIVVAPPGHAFGNVPLVADPRVQVVTNADPGRGMFSSIREGLAHEWAARAAALVVLPGDMPFVQPATVAAVLRAVERHGGVASPRSAGRRGHPVGFDQAIRARVLTAPATATLKAVLAQPGVPVVDCDVDDPGILRDVDRPGDL